jgi:hypothetical protein
MIALLVAQVAQAQCRMVAGPVIASATLGNVANGFLQMTLAHNGSVYVDADGGGTPSPVTVVSAAGVPVSTQYVPLDLRSVFDRHDGTADLYARSASDRNIYQRTPAGAQRVAATLSAYGPLDPQAAVVWDPSRSLYVANDAGSISAWNSRGAFVGSTTLVGFTLAEAAYPQGRGVAVSPGGCLLTYHQGVVSSWSSNGVRVDTVQLVGAGVNYFSYFTPSYTNGLFWVADNAGGTWRGYDLGL